MRSISSTLLDAIETGAICHYVKLTLSDASVIALTNHDVKFDLDGATYLPSPAVESVRYVSTLGSQINSQRIFATLYEGILTQASVQGGEYDDAVVEAGWIAWNISPKERMVVHTGLVSRIDYDDTGIDLEVLDNLKLLQTNFGRIYSTQDPFTFGDAQFALSEGSWTDSGQIDTITFNRFAFTATGDASFESRANNYYTYGKITFTNGNNNGKSTEVKVFETVGSDIVIELIRPTPYSMTVGDTFDIVAGYDGSFNQCKNKFSNGVNFGGFPHVKPIGEQS